MQQTSKTNTYKPKTAFFDTITVYATFLIFFFFFFFVTTVNNTHELGPLVEIRIPANESSLILKNLNYSTRYKFYFNAQTSVGSGSQITEEAVTIMDEGKMGMYKESPLCLKTTTDCIKQLCLNIAIASFH